MSTPSRFNSRPVLTLLTAATLLAAAPPISAFGPNAMSASRPNVGTHGSCVLAHLPAPSKTSKKSKSNKAASGKKSSKTSAKLKTSKTSAPQSSAEARRQQEEAQRDIQRTKEQIRLNEQQVKEGLSDLNRLQSEIQAGKTKVTQLEGKVSSLTKEMDGLSANIDSNEKELARMRAEYLKAVKKMRLTKKNQSALAFVFSSESFNQALRRVRYLRQFSDWKERQTKDIDAKIETLRKENERLAQVRTQQTATLGQLQASQKSLEDQHRRQGDIVAGLRQNGDVLNAHLTAKQAEANRLGQSISALIAQEQAKAETERKERERKAAAEKAAAEKAAAEKARREKEAAERAAAEKAAAEKAAADARMTESERKAAEKKEQEERKAAEKKAQEERKAAEKEAQEQKKAVDKRAKEANEAAKKSAEKKTKNSEKGSRKKGRAKDKNSYVVVNDKVESPTGSSNTSASSNTSNASAASAASAVAKSSFAAAKGSLPRPVDGSWRITNPFGRHAMPGLPDVEYDNPGIDAEVSKGAAAKAVYAGKVSGVYKLAGYGTVVIVNHGDYYTVYGNLSGSNVAVGTQVKAGQSLGSVAPDPDDPRRSSIHFEVWHGREKLNPSSWIK